MTGQVLAAESFWRGADQVPNTGILALLHKQKDWLWRSKFFFLCGLLFAHGGLRLSLLEHMLHLCPCTHTRQQEFCQQIQWCMDQAAGTHLRDLQLVHIKQQESGVNSHRSFNISSIINFTVEKYCFSNCWTILWICSKLGPNMVFSSLICFWGKYCISKISLLSPLWTHCTEISFRN